MFAYLQDVESLLQEGHLSELNRLKEMSQIRLIDHKKDCDQLQREMAALADEAFHELSLFEPFDDELKLNLHPNRDSINGQKFADKRVATPEAAIKQPLEQHKEDICDILSGLNDNLRNFSTDMEEKLTKSLTDAGLAKKYAMNEEPCRVFNPAESKMQSL